MKLTISFLFIILCAIPLVNIDTKDSHITATHVELTAQRPIKIRLLILKHCKEEMADDDANLAISAAKTAAARGLNIQVIGNHHIDKNGKSMQVCLWNDDYELPELRKFVAAQMKEKAERGDTLIVFTIGHGGSGGSLQSLGQRTDVMETLAGAAEQNNQKVLWWQLSCYASASLPKIESLPPQQQKLFSILASSNSTTQSPSGVEGKIMEKVLIALAEKSPDIDANCDGKITAQELKSFLDKNNTKRGDLLYVRNMQDVIFGAPFKYPIPIIDWTGPQGNYDLEDYVPYPDDFQTTK
jgi:hypothetical protein